MDEQASVEPIVLAHLIRDEDFTRKVLPFIELDYFTTEPHKLIFGAVQKFVTKYKTTPTFDAIRVELAQGDESTDSFDDSTATLKALEEVPRIDMSKRAWLVDKTEDWIKNRAVYLAVMQGIDILGKDGLKHAGQLPDILRKALSVGFHHDIGHDYMEDAERRYEFYHQKYDRIPFDLDILNRITEGGLLPKTLNVFAAGTNVGKSLFMCHVAAAAMQMGKNVLYITLEMAEERIAQRIDANLLDVGISTLTEMSKMHFMKLIDAAKNRHTLGKLVIKEYPTSGAHAGHFRALMDELAIKKEFKPDLLIIDYINICSSERFKSGDGANSYTYVKSIAEELRGLAVERNLPLLTATQFNREGFSSSDPKMTNTSESFGLPMTADLFVGIMTSEELEEAGELKFIQMKSRYSDMSKYRSFTIGLDRSKMRLYNIQQGYLADNVPRHVPHQPAHTSAGANVFDDGFGVDDQYVDPDSPPPRPSGQVKYSINFG